MKIAIYPGSFNPWHEGHKDILNKALQVFDRIIVAKGQGTNKVFEGWSGEVLKTESDTIRYVWFFGLLVDFIRDINKGNPKECITAVIRGLRNGYDLQYEMNMQYTNEDLGLTIPVVYFMTDRKYSHISSSTLRELNQYRVKR